MFSKASSGARRVSPWRLRRNTAIASAGNLEEIGEGASLDLAVLAIALAQQDSGGRAAVGDGGNVHDYYYSLAYNPFI